MNLFLLFDQKIYNKSLISTKLVYCLLYLISNVAHFMHYSFVCESKHVESGLNIRKLKKDGCKTHMKVFDMAVSSISDDH